MPGDGRAVWLLAMAARFNFGPRRPQDRAWAVLFLTCLAICISVGAHAAMNRGSAGTTLLEFLLRLLFADQKPSARLTATLALRVLSQHWLFCAAAAAGCTALGALLLAAVARHAASLARGAAGLALLYAFLSLSIVTFGDLQLALPDHVQLTPEFRLPLPSGQEPWLRRAVATLATLPPLGLLLALSLGWRRIGAAAEQLGRAAQGLLANPCLVALVTAASAASLAAAGPLLSLVSWPEAPWAAPQEGQCSSGLDIPPTRLDRAAVAFSAFVVWWGANFLSQLLTFVVAGTLGRWARGNDTAGRAGRSQPRAAAGAARLAAAARNSWQRVWAAVRQALGPSLGSLALASLPLAAQAVFVGQALARVKSGAARHGWPYEALLHAPARCLLGLLLSWSGAATALMACTGEGFTQAAAAAAALVGWRTLLGLSFTVLVATAAVFMAIPPLAVGHLICTIVGFGTLGLRAGLQSSTLEGALVNMLLLIGSIATGWGLLLLLAALLLNATWAVGVLELVVQEEQGGAAAAGTGKKASAGSATATPAAKVARLRD